MNKLAYETYEKYLIFIVGERSAAYIPYIIYNEGGLPFASNLT